MKYYKEIKFTITSVLIVLFLMSLSLANDFDTTKHAGNHTDAKSEAWTWTGNLNEIAISPNGEFTLQDNGHAFIHYYTRNETGFGRMNFKSSAVTQTTFGTGTSYDKLTVYSDLKKDSFKLKVHEDKLDISFVAHQKNIDQEDQVREVSMTSADEDLLYNQLLPMYPGLKVAEGFTVKKYVFKAFLGHESYADLIFYSLWPDIAPPEGRMKFFGTEDSYTFSTPMLLAFGDWVKNGETKKVAGLCFLDRQWSHDYFGKKIFNNPTEFFKRNHALKKAHNWAAFHVHSSDYKNWYFIHLWQQYNRSDDEADEITDYTGVQWTKNGVQQDAITKPEMKWKGSDFILNSSEVMINFAHGRKAYFPSSYDFLGVEDKFSFHVDATPAMQSLDQPIYLYEGYASGKGVWDGADVFLKGRVESSQVFFRDQDYQSMIDNLEFGSLKDELTSFLDNRNRCLPEAQACLVDIIRDQYERSEFLFHDLPLKMKIFSAQFMKRPKRDSENSHYIIYN